MIGFCVYIYHLFFFFFFKNIITNWRRENSWILNLRFGLLLIYTDTDDFTTWDVLGSIFIILFFLSMDIPG